MDLFLDHKHTVCKQMCMILYAIDLSVLIFGKFILFLQLFYYIWSYH